MRATVRGRVQGVGYRAWFADEALALGLSGWVRNRQDGSVEAVIAGEEPAVGRMIEACWRGPRLSRVAAVETVPATDEGWSDLAIRRDA